MIDHDLDDLVAQAVASAEYDGCPITYATGPMSDRRVDQAFRRFGVRAPKDRLCASIKRLVNGAVINRHETGECIVAAGNTLRPYPVVRLTGG